MDKYCLVDCDFHDQLEAFATLRQVCQISYHHPNGELAEAHDRIVDIYAANNADFLRLTDGTEIRLDRLISVNGKLNYFVRVIASNFV
jgi:Rho-binding antiterminator